VEKRDSLGLEDDLVAFHLPGDRCEGHALFEHPASAVPWHSTVMAISALFEPTILKISAD
jgi:hypothetical protein